MAAARGKAHGGPERDASAGWVQGMGRIFWNHEPHERVLGVPIPLVPANAGIQIRGLGVRRILNHEDTKGAKEPS